MSKWMAVVVAVLTAAGALIPAVAWAYGQKAGPCTVSVRCNSGQTISCSGQTVCYWKYETGGFVQCDSQPRIYCLSPELVDEETGLELE